MRMMVTRSDVVDIYPPSKGQIIGTVSIRSHRTWINLKLTETNSIVMQFRVKNVEISITVDAW